MQVQSHPLKKHYWLFYVKQSPTSIVFSVDPMKAGICVFGSLLKFQEVSWAHRDNKYILEWINKSVRVLLLGYTAPTIFPFHPLEVFKSPRVSMTYSELYAYPLVRKRQASVTVTSTKLCAVKDLWLPKGKLEGSYQEKAERIPGVQFTFSPHRIHILHVNHATKNIWV